MEKLIKLIKSIKFPFAIYADFFISYLHSPKSVYG